MVPYHRTFSVGVVVDTDHNGGSVTTVVDQSLPVTAAVDQSAAFYRQGRQRVGSWLKADNRHEIQGPCQSNDVEHHRHSRTFKAIISMLPADLNKRAK